MKIVVLLKGFKPRAFDDVANQVRSFSLISLLFLKKKKQSWLVGRVSWRRSLRSMAQ